MGEQAAAGTFYDNGLQAAKFESSLLEFKLGHLEA